MAGRGVHPDLFDLLNAFVYRDPVRHERRHAEHHQVRGFWRTDNIEPAMLGMDLFTCLCFERCPSRRQRQSAYQVGATDVAPLEHRPGRCPQQWVAGCKEHRPVFARRLGIPP